MSMIPNDNQIKKQIDSNNVEKQLVPGGDSAQLHPFEQTTDPFAIGINCCFTSIMAVNIQEKRFRANYLLVLRYRPEIAPDTLLAEGSTMEYEGRKYRKLPFSISNSIESEMQSDTAEWLIDPEAKTREGSDYRPVLQIFQQCKACFRMSISENISDFPIDTHNLMLSMLILPSIPNYSKYYFGSITTSFMSNFPFVRNVEPVADEWTIYEAEQIQFQTSINRVFFQMGFVIQRKLDFYFWNSFVLTFILVGMCFTLFAMQIDVANRLTLILTAVLTIVALKLSFASVIPKSPKTNYMDAYINGCITYLLMFMIVIAAIDNDQTPAEYKTSISDNWLAFAVLMIWLVYNMLFCRIILKRKAELTISGRKPVAATPFDDVRWHGKKNWD